MGEHDALSDLIERLKQTGLADFPGKLLYSSLDTLRPGKLYLLGYNPGGDPAEESESVASHLRHMPAGWNEYVDAEWRPAGIRRRPGSAPRQRRVQWLLAHLGLPVRSVCASNLIFVRSKSSAGLSDPDRMAEQCWPVHRFILERVRPACILSIGGKDVWEFVCEHSRMLTPVEPHASGHGNWQCLSARIELDRRQMTFVTVPDVTRYAIDRHENVVRWIASQL